MLIDIHSHLDHCYFNDDLDKVISNAKKENVKVILTAGINPEKNKISLEIANKYDIVKPCLGIYPIQYDNKEDNSNNNKKSIKKIKTMFNNNLKNINIDEEIKFIEENKKKVVAIGEVGLDYFWVKDKVNEQKKLFEKMILLAEKLNKPIIVHSRKAEEDAIDMLQSSKLKKIVMHLYIL